VKLHTRLGLLLCRLGLHRWRQSRPFSALREYSRAEFLRGSPYRTCLRCRARQIWVHRFVDVDGMRVDLGEWR